MVNYAAAVKPPMSWYNVVIKEQRRPYGNKMIKKMVPTNDFIFQRLFGEDETKDSLLSFLNSILQLEGEERIKDLKVIEYKQLAKDLYHDKTGRLDIRAKTEDGIQINIEMQLENKKNMVKGSLFYVAKLYMGSIKAGGKHKDLKKTVAINILGYNKFQHTSRFQTTYQFKDNMDTDFTLTDVMVLHFIEYPKFRKAPKDLNNPLHRWLLFLDDKLSEDQRKELINMDPDIAKAEERLAWLRGDEETIRLFEAREMAEIERNSDLWEAEEKGLTRGKAEGKAEIALNLLRKGMDISLIAEVTEMPTKEIEALKKKL